MGDGVSQLAALIDRTGSFRRHMAGDATGERKLLAQTLQTRNVLADIGVYLAIGTFQIGIGNEEVAAVTRAGDQDHVQIILIDDSIQMGIDKILPWHRAPMTDDLLLDMIHGQGLAKERVIQQIGT